MVSSGPVGYPLGEDPSGYRVVRLDRKGVRHEYLPLTGVASGAIAPQSAG
jgi:hypothetical protein